MEYKGQNVRYWHLADIARCTAHVCFEGGKADMTFAPSTMSAFDPKRTFPVCARVDVGER